MVLDKMDAQRMSSACRDALRDDSLLRYQSVLRDESLFQGDATFLDLARGTFSHVSENQQVCHSCARAHSCVHMCSDKRCGSVAALDMSDRCDYA